MFRNGCIAFAAAFVALTSRGGAQTTAPPITTPQRPVPAQPGHADRREAVRFAVIGDYGLAGPGVAAVANRIGEIGVDFILTVGDNNYEDGAASTIDANIGQYYHSYMSPYVGAYGAGAAANRFFPSLGNHDWNTPGAAPYINYFSLPGNERYYEFARGPVRCFALDLDPHEPDGIFANSVQGQWLQARLAAAAEPFKFVYHHFPPYSSAEHGDSFWAQWPYQQWGATAVFTGHDHDYERLSVGGFPYFVNGLGGKTIYAFGEPVAGSDMRFNADFGAMIVDATNNSARIQFVTKNGIVADTCTLTPQSAWWQETPLVSKFANWKYWDSGSAPPAGWRTVAFDDSAWSAGNAQLGYGDGDEQTILGFGPNPNNKYPSAYFRKTFAVANPALFRGLRLRVLRDDGAIAYLNGVEVFRTNMPAGTVTFATLASAPVADQQEFSWYEAKLPPSAVVAGVNVLAVEVHQSAVDSSDLSFDAELVGLSGATELSPAGAVWKYWDLGIPPGAAWTEGAFDDSGWSAGNAQLGYGDGDEATVVGFGGNPNNKYVTTYFRRQFQVVSPSQFKTLLLRIVRDDGAIVYLNGHEIYRSNLAFGGAVPPNALAGFAIAGSDESQFWESRCDPQFLIAGTNVLAVEIHQSSVTSSDLSFDLELLAF